MAKRGTDKHNVDRLDVRIMTALCERGRQTIAELSKMVGLSPSPCSARLERLESNSLIRGYHADIDLERLGDFSLYYVTITLKNYSPARTQKFEALLLDSTYIVAADGLFGSWDYVLQIYARSTQHYQEIMAPLLEYEIDYQTWPVSRRLMRLQMHRLVAQLGNVGR